MYPRMNGAATAERSPGSASAQAFSSRLIVSRIASGERKATADPPICSNPDAGAQTSASSAASAAGSASGESGTRTARSSASRYFVAEPESFASFATAAVKSAPSLAPSADGEFGPLQAASAVARKRDERSALREPGMGVRNGT